MPLNDSMLAKRKFERLLCRTTFLFHFSYPLQLFIYKDIKKTQRFLVLILDLCDYVKEEKLSYFTLSMLKETCTFLELPFKTRDSKAVLLTIIKEMTHDYQCSVEG